MTESVKIIARLVGEFVTPEVVKTASQKDYNQYIWERNVESYLKYGQVKFFKTVGSIYDFDYYVIYVVDGKRFMQEVTYNSSLTNGGFAYGFYIEGCKNAEAVAKLKELDFEVYKNFDKDIITVLQHTDGRIGNHKEAIDYMKQQTLEVPTRFFTKCF